MNYKLLLNTVVHLRPTQVYHQIKYRLKKPAYVAMAASLTANRSTLTALKTEPIPRYKSLEGDVFTFLNLSHEFAGWDFNEYGNLWTYNQNYFDWLNQEGASTSSVTEGCKWIDRFIKEHESHGSHELKNKAIGLDPYPIALRCINWIKFFCRYPECATKERLDSLYSQVRLLEKKLEYHLLGNHLLEDAYALYTAAVYFEDERLLKKASKLLIGQLKEQILPDGAHYEQSPMYHCILLDRLLDAINISKNDVRCKKENVRCLSEYAERMLGHLESIIWSDGSIPLLNDAAYGIAPTPAQLFDYARRLGIEWKAIPMKECGYRKMKNERMEAIVDVGNVTATYQPGHTHADSLNYELRVDGKPFVVDTGISTYNKNERRQLERSTVAHNCVVVDGKDSSEVWGGFRVGRRCDVRCKKEEGRCVEASHDGFGKPCKRRFEMTEEGFTVEDWYEGEAVSYVHLAEGADANRLVVSGEGLENIQTQPWKYSTEYNRFHDGKVVEIQIKKHLKYTIL